MTTLDEAAHSILDTLRGGHSSDYEPVDIRHIYYTIDYYRSLLIRRDFSRSQAKKGGEGLTQELGKVAVELRSEDDGSPNVDDLLVRTTRKIPQPVRMKKSYGITRISPFGHRRVFPFIRASRARWSRYSGFTGDNTRAYLHDGRIHLTTTGLTQDLIDVFAGIKSASDISVESIQEHSGYITIEGIFEDPRAAYEFATGDAFDPKKDPYPLPKDIEQRIAQSLLNGEFKIATNTEIDDESTDHQESTQT